MEALALGVRSIDFVIDWIGKAIAWLLVGIVIVVFTAVTLRYAVLPFFQEALQDPAFREGIGAPILWLRENYVKIQESYVWMHAVAFMGGAAYTLLHDGHVRVDIFYRASPPKRKAWVNLFGVIFLLFPLLALVGMTSYGYVAESWLRQEHSHEAGGLPGLFLLKSMLLVFVALMAAQGLSLIGRSILIINNHPEFIPPQEAHEGI